MLHCISTLLSRIYTFIRFFLVQPVEDLVIVTAADSSHFKSLKQFLTSVSHHAKEWPVIVFDLGFDRSQHDELTVLFPAVQVRFFDFSRYPDYFNITINAGEYAWKPVIITDILDEFKRPVCWMDAGNVLTNRLVWLRKVLYSIGMYSPRSAGCIQDWTHPATLKFLEASNILLRKHNLNGACVAVNYRFDRAMRLMEQWKQCAFTRECIAPEGSGKKNHRQDQAVLSVLAHQAGITKRMPRCCLGFKTHQDID